MNIQKRNIDFPSADGVSTIHAEYWFDKDVVKVGILQIANGMCEHIERYADFMQFMATKGFVVCINDHLGHGASSLPENYGFFAKEGGAHYVLKDMYTLHSAVKGKFHKLKAFLLGHSMGSFFARWFTEEYPDVLDGVIYMGTAGPNAMAGTGIALTKAIAKLRGPKYRSKLIYNMSTGGYTKTIENVKTPYDWISKDEAVVAKYAADSRCTFMFTVSGYKDIFETLQRVSTLEWAKNVSQNLSILLVSGAEDPVGNFGKGVQDVFELLEKTEHKHVTLKLYENMRHEPLNEVNHMVVYNDIAAWLLNIADPYISCTCMSRTIRRSRKCGHCSF